MTKRQTVCSTAFNLVGDAVDTYNLPFLLLTIPKPLYTPYNLHPDMLFDPSTADHLKPWLTKTLEPMSVPRLLIHLALRRLTTIQSQYFRCDAEPGALADYILALLKHNAPEIELRKELASQLDEFLEKGEYREAVASQNTRQACLTEGPSFIDMLFTTLRTKSYLPYSTSSPPSSSHAPVDNGIPIPLDAFMSPSMSTSPERGRKRNMEYDDRDGRPAKGPRLTHDGQYAGYPRGHDNWSNGGYGRGGRGRGGAYGGADMGMDVNMGGMGMNGRGQQQYRPPDQKKGICRDYHSMSSLLFTLNRRVLTPRR